MRILVSPGASFLRDPIIPSLWDAPFLPSTRLSVSCQLPGVRDQKLFNRRRGGGGCDHPRGSRMSWAGSRGSREELRPPFDAAKHSAALTGSLQPFSLQSRPRQSSAPIPMDCRDRAPVPGVIWGSCDKGRQGRARLGRSPGAAPCCSDLLSLPFPSFLLLIQPFPCPLAAVCPCGREPCRVPQIPSPLLELQGAGRNRGQSEGSGCGSSFVGQSTDPVSCSTRGCRWNPGWLQESSPAVPHGSGSVRAGLWVPCGLQVARGGDRRDVQRSWQ